MTREEAINEIKSWDFLEGKEIEAIHTLIPELRESGDERIRKKLIEYFSHFKEDREWWEGITPRDIISYLEKQKLRKFKLGDKVHWYDDDTNVITITGFRDDAYLTDSAYGPILFCDEDNWGKIGQKPIKCIDFYDEFHKLYTGPKDILAYVNIFVKKLGHVPIDIHELSACVHYVIKHKEEDTKAKQKEQKPAEWDELQSEFENIDEAFEDGKKEVVAHPEKYGLCKRSEVAINGEPIPTENHSVDIPLAEWSKEDETHRDFILESLEDQIKFCKKDAKGAHYAKQIRTAQDWLKDIFLNHKKCIEAVDKLCSNKWSEEDEKIWNHIIDCAESRAWIPFNEISWLVAHKPQSHWKPSEHQMNILKAVKDYVGEGSGYWGEGLGSLIDDLEKLM